MEALLASFSILVLFLDRYMITFAFLGHKLVSLSSSVVACVVGLCITLTQALDALSRMEAWSLVVVCILAFILLLNVFLIWRHPQNPTKASFMVRTLTAHKNLLFNF